jgi:hypothetical protein
MLSRMINLRLILLLAALVNMSIEAQTPAPKNPFFQLDARAKRALVEKASTLKPGDSYQSVTDRLGAPTHDQKIARKEGSRVVGRSLSYYAVIWQSGLVNELHDELVEVYLDERDLVRSVHIRVTLE